MKENMFAKVICDSVSADGVRITTLHLKYPRFIHSEIMTHRDFSRNGRSSRAVPIKTMLDEVRNNSVIPWHWGKNQPGMAAGEDWDSSIHLERVIATETGDKPYTTVLSKEEAWLEARDAVLKIVEAYDAAGYHKQIPNRLLEPFMWMDTLVTSTNWANFFHLRTDKSAVEPHFYDLACLVNDSLTNSIPQVLEHDELHLPYITELEKEFLSEDELLKVSVARCARISYTPFDGNPSYDKEFERYDKLVGSDPLHASPAEHQAWPDVHDIFPLLHGNFRGWCQYRKTLKNERVYD